MERYLPLLRQVPLFQGIREQDLSAMLRCLAAREAHYPRGALLLLAGQPVREMGLVLDGHAVVLTEDYWGNRNILSSLQAGDLFAEVFACNPGFPAQVSVEAAGEVSGLWLDGGKVLAPCCSGCTFHLALIRRLFEMVTKKNLLLTEKMNCLTRRTTREKLLSYLSQCARKAGSSTFSIPFNRQQLADYLSVDRSAMSSELSKLREEGILSFEKNRFALKEAQSYTGGIL